MTFLTARDHSALRMNMSSVIDMFIHSELSSADAVADVVRICHADSGTSEDQGLDSYVAKILSLVDSAEASPAWALDHLVALATAKNPDEVLRPELI